MNTSKRSNKKTWRPTRNQAVLLIAGFVGIVAAEVILHADSAITLGAVLMLAFLFAVDFVRTSSAPIVRGAAVLAQRAVTLIRHGFSEIARRLRESKTTPPKAARTAPTARVASTVPSATGTSF